MGMIVLIMGIGFSVDFSAHISYHYLSADEDHLPEQRLAHCLHALGPPILQGATTTILSVLPLIRHPSYVIVTFTKMIILVIVLGLLHGLLLLPVLLTLFGPGSCTKKPRRPITHSQINIMSPIAAVSETFIYENSHSSTLKKSKYSTPSIIKNNLVRVFGDNEKSTTPQVGTATLTATNLHLSFFKPTESDTSDANISSEGNNFDMKSRGFTESSVYSYQKRHLRRSVKKVKARSRDRASSEGDIVDIPKIGPRESLRLKMSAIQADLKAFSPLRVVYKNISTPTNLDDTGKDGTENKAFDVEICPHDSFNANDTSIINLSTFRPQDILLNTTVNNNVIMEPKLVL